MANHQMYIDAVKRTGFVLENRVALQLKSGGWTIISNKFYEDDHSGTVREVDLVAYKVGHAQNFDVYTVLIVSCKKSEENVWALLSRDLNLRDPNADWWPLHAWSNEPALQYKLAEAGCAKRYHAAATTAGVSDALNLPEVEVFAFQELSKVTGAPVVPKKKPVGKEATKSSSAPRNDAAIFNSITSLMKAQAYEIGVLPNRKKSPAVYQFNLLTVTDTELLRMRFRGTDIDCAPVPSEHYIGRYIINRRETFSRIRFVREDAFGDALRDYGRLHDANLAWFTNECDAFFKGILQDWKRTQVLIDRFRADVNIFVKWQTMSALGKSIDMQTANITFSEALQKAYVSVDASPDEIAFLDAAPKIKDRVAVALEKVYRYAGPFEFIEDIPF